MYEYFDFDVDNVIFEWDDEKEHINFVKTLLSTVFISKLLPRYFLIHIK